MATKLPAARQTTRPPKLTSSTPESDTGPKATADFSEADQGDQLGAHLEALTFPDIEDVTGDPYQAVPLDQLDQGDGIEGDQLDQLPATNKIDRAAFWTVFQTAFDMPQLFVPALKPLAIAPNEQSSARAASDSTYALLEIYYPAALKPGSETLAHLLTAMPFFIAKAMIVRELVAASRAKPVQTSTDFQTGPEGRTQPDRRDGQGADRHDDQRDGPPVKMENWNIEAAA